MRSYSQLSEFDLLLDLGIWPWHFDFDILVNIHLHLWQFSLTEVSKILTLGELFKVKVKSQGQKSRSKDKVKATFGAAFYKLRYEPSLKSLWQLDVKL